MILLSEVADKIQNEVRSWSSHHKMRVGIQINPSLIDARDGEEWVLTELLTMPLGFLPEAVSCVNIVISGMEEEIIITYSFDTAAITALPFWRNLADKAVPWNPRIHIDDNAVSLVLNLPESADYPLVNLEVMAETTGISIDEALLIFEGFIPKARSQMKILSEGIRIHGSEECFRAAHSLKGAGKNLRAPILAAAAGALERDIRENREILEDYTQLETIWKRIELWFEGEST